MHYSIIDLRVYHARVPGIDDIHRRVMGRYSAPSYLGGLEEHRQFRGTSFPHDQGTASLLPSSYYRRARTEVDSPRFLAFEFPS